MTTCVDWAPQVQRRDERNDCVWPGQTGAAFDVTVGRVEQLGRRSPLREEREDVAAIPCKHRGHAMRAAICTRRNARFCGGRRRSRGFAFGCEALTASW